MQITKAFIFVLGAVAPVAQANPSWKLDQVPKCAHDCLAKSISVSKCDNPTDLACICNSKPFREAAKPCVMSSCSLEDAYVPLNQSLHWRLCAVIHDKTYEANVIASRYSKKVKSWAIGLCKVLVN